jgi:hypothetical protein
LEEAVAITVNHQADTEVLTGQELIPMVVMVVRETQEATVLAQQIPLEAMEQQV